jgi:uncharacterized protein (DUF1330 family)
MAAYWLARAVVNDPVEYKRYTDLVPAIIAKYHGKVHARGGNFKHLEGNGHYQRHIVIEFPTFEDAIACFESEEYQEARKFRLNGVGDNELMIVEGGDATT